MDDVEPYTAITGHTDFLLQVAGHASLAEIVVAVDPYLRVHLSLGTELAASLRPGDPYEEWINTCSGDEFEHFCARLEELLYEIASNSSAVRDSYRYAMQYELYF